MSTHQKTSDPITGRFTLCTSMSMVDVTLSSKNQIVIPRDAREALGVKSGDKLLVVAKDGKVLIMARPKSFAESLKGMGKKPYSSDYIEQERDSWD